MLHRSDDSDPSRTLPRPELNPLLNPLLGENMGRWAEVYYTSAPEKRQEAVLELLRELEIEKAQRGDVTPDETESASLGASLEDQAPGQSFPAVNEPQPVYESRQASNYCPACGHENFVDQKFCGMCGAPIAADGADPAARGEETWPTEFEAALPRQFSTEPAMQHTSDYEHASDEEAAKSDDVMPQRLQDFFQPRNDDYPRDLFFLQSQEEEPRSHYRLYLGAALAVIILALGYVAWRNGQNNSTSGQLAPQAPPAATEAAPAAAAPPAQPARSVSSSEPSTPNGDQVSSTGRAHETNQPVKSNPAASVTKEPSTAVPQPQVSTPGGQQELAVAEGYLNGTNGQQRNSAEAAQWLWKAVEKRNAAATLLLSDLYLQGNGVPKNCDQAHVLLDAAASRGVRDAADRLRNLRAFGCE